MNPMDNWMENSQEVKTMQINKWSSKKNLKRQQMKGTQTTRIHSMKRGAGRCTSRQRGPKPSTWSRKPGAPPCRWCRGRRRQRAGKHRLNWGWVHCSTALTHAVIKTTAVRPTHQRHRQSCFLKRLNLFICTVQFKMTCYWLFLSANEFFSRLGWLSETYCKISERCRERAVLSALCEHQNDPKRSVWALLLLQDAKKDKTIKWTVSRWSCCDWLSSALLEQ